MFDLEYKMLSWTDGYESILNSYERDFVESVL